MNPSTAETAKTENQKEIFPLTYIFFHFLIYVNGRHNLNIIYSHDCKVHPPPEIKNVSYGHLLLFPLLHYNITLSSSETGGAG